jgi:hypothetical protein
MIEQDILDYLTREQTLELWATPYTNSHYLVEAIHGDGKQLVWFETMDSRPFHYYIRIDSSLDLNKDDWEILSKDDRDAYGEFPEMLMQMIEEEVDNIDRYEEQVDGLYTNEQDISEGHPPFEYKWPMFSLGAGWSYGTVDLEWAKRQMAQIVET